MSATTSQMSSGSIPSKLDAAAIFRRGWIMTILVTILFMINFADKAVLGLAATPIMRDFHLSPTQFGELSGVFFLFFGISGIIGGIVSTRVPANKILLALALLWGVAMVPVLVVPSLAMLYVNRIALGAAEGPTSPIITHFVQKWFDEAHRTLPTSVSYIGGGLGLFVAGPLLTWSIFHWGWRVTFGLLAIVAVLWAVMWFFVGQEGPYTTYASMEEKPNKWQGALDPHVSYSRLFISRTWLGMFIAGIGAYWALVAGIVWMPRVLEEVLGYSHGTVGFLVAVPPAISVIAMMLVPWLSSRAIKAGASRRIMRGVLLGGGVVVCGILAFIVPRVHGAASVTLMCIVFGAPSFVYPLVGLMIAHINPVKQRGVMLATLTAFITATGFFAPGLLGHAIQAGGGLKSGGFTGFFDLTAIIMIVTGLIGAVSIHPQFDARRFGLERS